MWQLGINTKFSSRIKVTFIFRPRLLLQRGAEYSNDIDCSSDGIDCLKPASRIRGWRALVFHLPWNMPWFIRPFAIRNSNQNPESSKRRTPLVLVISSPITGHDFPTECLVMSANGSTCVRRCFSTSGSPESNNPSESPIFPKDPIALPQTFVGFHGRKIPGPHNRIVGFGSRIEIGHIWILKVTTSFRKKKTSIFFVRLLWKGFSWRFFFRPWKSKYYVFLVRLVSEFHHVSPFVNYVRVCHASKRNHHF